VNKIYNSINNFFSSAYANKNAIEGNVLSLMLYKLAYPSARLFARLSLKPDVITWLSIVFTGLAVFSLFSENGPAYFVIFWLISLHLDFSDGTLARMTKKISKSAFRLDHMTDLIKLFMVFISLGIFYNTVNTWILVCAAVFTLMYSEILSHEIKHYLKRAAENKVEFSETTLIESKWMKIAGISKFKFLINILRNINSIFFGISGHTLIFFCVVPFGVMYANIFLFYFTVICIYGIIRTVISLSSLKR
jgi:phosphatidylglycerophosphate synthase